MQSQGAGSEEVTLSLEVGRNQYENRWEGTAGAKTLRLDIVKDRRKDWNPAGAGRWRVHLSAPAGLLRWPCGVHQFTPFFLPLVHGLHRGATLHAIPGLQHSHPGHQVSLPDEVGWC